MDELLKQLVFQVQQYPCKAEERQKALVKLVDQMLRSRQICRQPKGESLANIYLDIFQAVQRQLRHDVDQSVDSYDPRSLSVRDWASSLRDGAFQKVLDDFYLTQLALEAQRHKPQTQQWQYALRELLNAIRLSGKLSYQRQSSTDTYEDAVSRTLLWICQSLNAYDPSKGRFMAWVNYRLDMTLREIKQEYKDPFIQSIEGKLIRRRYQLKVIIKRTKKTDLRSWLILKLKGLVPDNYLGLQVVFILTVLLLLSQLITQTPLLGDSLLLEMSKESLSLSLKKYELTKESKILENIAQPEEKPFLSELVRQCIERDPAGLFQKHIREHPQATFQAIALARLDGKTWKEMSDFFGIGIPALNNFFQRRLKELAPEIRKYAQEQFE